MISLFILNAGAEEEENEDRIESPVDRNGEGDVDLTSIKAPPKRRKKNQSDFQCGRFETHPPKDGKSTGWSRDEFKQKLLGKGLTDVYIDELLAAGDIVTASNNQLGRFAAEEDKSRGLDAIIQAYNDFNAQSNGRLGGGSSNARDSPTHRLPETGSKIPTIPSSSEKSRNDCCGMEKIPPKSIVTPFISRT